MTNTSTVRPPSPRAISYLTDLVRDRDTMPGKTAEESLAALTRWFATPRTAQEVSAKIDFCKAKPRRVARPVAAARPVRAAQPSISEGVLDAKYAIYTAALTEIPDAWARQEFLFVEVKKYRGRRVIRRLLGAPGRFSRNFLTGELAAEVLGLLESPEFAEAASTRFGEIYQCCGKCAAELTDDESRRLKMGPICRGQWERHLAARAARTAVTA